MLRSIKQLYGNQLGATDGEIGHVKDFYFDDQNWAIRYLVADTGHWLPGRLVLISPYSLGRLDQTHKILRVNLTRQQIENSPSIDAHKPVSRQYEEEYYRHYGWPNYWQGDGLWGLSGSPVVEPPSKPLPTMKTAKGCPSERAEAHLWSAQGVTGYHFRTAEGIVGHVCDFMMDATNWAIDQWVIRTGNRLSGNEVLIPTKDIARISYEESTVFERAAGEPAPRRPAADLAPTAGAT